ACGVLSGWSASACARPGLYRRTASRTRLTYPARAKRVQFTGLAARARETAMLRPACELCVDFACVGLQAAGAFLDYLHELNRYSLETQPPGLAHLVGASRACPRASQHDWPGPLRLCAHPARHARRPRLVLRAGGHPQYG